MLGRIRGLPRSLWRGGGCGRSRRRSARRPSAGAGRRSRPGRGSCERSRRRWRWRRQPASRRSRCRRRPRDERKGVARGRQHGPAAVAVLDVGRVRLQHQGTTVGVDEGVALSALDLLAGVVAPGPAGLRPLDALAVEHPRRRAGGAPAARAVEHDQLVVRPLQNAVSRSRGTSRRPSAAAGSCRARVGSSQQGDPACSPPQIALAEDGSYHGPKVACRS